MVARWLVVTVCTVLVMVLAVALRVTVTISALATPREQRTPRASGRQDYDRSRLRAAHRRYR